MKDKLLERRLELLRLEGNGLEPSEIVKELSVKYGVSKRAIYLDFETRRSWQPLLQETKEAQLKVWNRHEQIFRKGVVTYMQAKTDRGRIAALNLLRQINFDLAELTGVKSQKSAAPEETRIRWEDPEVCKEES